VNTFFFCEAFDSAFCILLVFGFDKRRFDVSVYYIIILIEFFFVESLAVRTVRRFALERQSSHLSGSLTGHLGPRQQMCMRQLLPNAPLASLNSALGRRRRLSCNKCYRSPSCDGHKVPYPVNSAPGTQSETVLYDLRHHNTLGECQLELQPGRV